MVADLLLQVFARPANQAWRLIGARTRTCLRQQLLAALVVLALCLSIVAAEEECLSPNKVWCYECESKDDKRCADPFNITAHPNELPSMVHCQGCCVKIVMNKNTPYQSVRRTCTSKIQINLFMVDHVCMEESDGQGHMCFCESDACNQALRQSRVEHSLLLLVPLLGITLRTLLLR